MKIYGFHIATFVSIVCLTVASTVPLVVRPSFDLQVTDAWIRWLPVKFPGAGYMTLTNKGSTAQELIGASSPEYEEITLHRTRRIAGMAGMESVASIRLAPATSVNFEREGYHLMLMRPRRSIRAGERIAIALRFSSGQSITVPFAVRAADAGTARAERSRAPSRAMIV